MVPSMSSDPGKLLVNMPLGLAPNCVAAQYNDRTTFVTCSSSWSTALCNTLSHGLVYGSPASAALAAMASSTLGGVFSYEDCCGSESPPC
jgi:hypothetical protein